MLSDEEEAIEWLKRLVKINKRDNLDDTFAEILLNLIEKQSKEIEELKEKNKPQPDCEDSIERTEEMVNMIWVNHNYINKKESEQKEKQAYKFGYNNGCNDTSKFNDKNFIRIDKIKEILGIEEDINNEKLLSLLQTIVDENARLENIEDRKVQIEYNNVFNKGVKSVEDKIKAKIEEVDKDENASIHDFMEYAKEYAKQKLQSLLEEE